MITQIYKESTRKVYPRFKGNLVDGDMLCVEQISSNMIKRKRYVCYGVLSKALLFSWEGFLGEEQEKRKR